SGLEVKLVGTDLTTFIKRSELARDRSEQRTERFAVGEKVDARVTQFDRRAHKVTVSIKALEVAEAKEAIAQYGSSDSAATRAAGRYSRPRAQAGDREEGMTMGPSGDARGGHSRCVTRRGPSVLLRASMPIPPRHRCQITAPADRH